MGCCTLLHLTEDNARFVLLAIVLVLYMLAGAALFQYLEGEAELKMANEFWKIYSDFRRHYLLLILQAGNNTGVHNNGLNCTTESNENDASQENSSHPVNHNDLDMEKVHQLLYAYGNATSAGIIHKRRRWDFAGSFHFVGTIVSTIGECLTIKNIVIWV
ncbi:Potassium channel subfamily K member 13 [Blattella germanica]|nr:Potassium channel subfamily K member 13 [Blattella germanica]